MPEASSTCERVGALAACASASVGAANAAETAVAMRSFFIERPFVGGKNTSAALYLGWNLPGCSTAGSHRTLARNALPLTCLIPTNVPGFARAALLENVKIAGATNPEIGARIDQNEIFSNYRMRPLWAARGAAMMDAISATAVQREFTRLHLQYPQGLLAVQPPHDDPRASRPPAGPRRGHHLAAVGAGAAQQPRRALRGLAGGAAVRISRRPGVAGFRLRAERRLRPRPPRQRDPQPLPDRARRKRGRLAPCPGASRHASLRDRAAGDRAAPALHLRAPRAARARPSPPGRRDHRANESRGARGRAGRRRGRFQRLAQSRRQASRGGPGPGGGLPRPPRQAGTHLPELLPGSAPGPHLRPRIPRAPHARAPRADVAAPVRPRRALCAPAARISRLHGGRVPAR